MKAAARIALTLVLFVGASATAEVVVQSAPPPPTEPAPPPPDDKGSTPEKAPAPPPGTPTGPDEPIVVRDHRTIRSYGANIGHNMVEVWKVKSVPVLLGGGALTAASLLVDDSAIRYFDRHPMKGYGNAGRILGTGVVALGASTAILGIGRYSNGDRFRAATYDMSQAVVVNFFYTLVLKEATHRPRPDGSDKLSFPSGHASNAFACASVWAEQYGVKGAIPAYLAATLVSGSRLALKKHHLSDVVGGATLGYIVGKSVARWDAKPSHKPIPPGKVGIVPTAGPGGSGMGLAIVATF
jgi:membrane-associated phospholipid phosphatase